MSISKKYQGIVIPAVTPLSADHRLDEAAVEKLLNFFRNHEVLPFILGTSGEAPSLPLSVKQAYIRVAGRMKRMGELLYAGISSNCLQDSVEMGKYCFGEGVDVVVATLPSYYALTDDQMKRYFEQLAERVRGPLIIYNIPATTHLSIPLRVIDELSHHPDIVGTKDSERNEERLKDSLQLWAGREDFSHFLGWAAKSAEALLNGGDGLVPSTGNINPGIYQEMYKAVRNGQSDKVLEMQALSDQLGNSYQNGRSLGESLAALKLIMQEQGLCQPYMMPPL
jgi:4-hydroxy-tetrahydrodipicolinate synthase